MKPARRKQKVFEARLGFYDSVVAAPSQAAALRAWGVRQNLFADGQARITADPQAIKAASARPEVRLRRPVGSTGPFRLEPEGLPSLPGVAKGAATKAKAASTAPKSAAKPPPDRSRLDDAEAALRRLDHRRKQEEADLRRQREVLEQEIADAQTRYVAARKSAAAEAAEARALYRRAGGEDWKTQG